MVQFQAGQRLTAEALNSLAEILGNVQGITVGMVTITPVAGVVTSQTVTGLTTPGTNFAAFVTASTGVPGTVEEVSASEVTATQLTVNLMRSNTTNTGVWWVHIGYS
ncbi:hypothetical protein [Actinomadura sp. SCN-SB]|uniref:hypothetical protein n=1 Tax=Actinomadura sp. SCN-SB TaxID=3373092 RepID=UPI0037501E38